MAWPTNVVVTDQVITLTPLMGVQVIPSNTSAFYKEDFVIKASNLLVTDQVLIPNVDFKFSPMYLTYSAALGKEVYSYIVLLDTNWTSVKVTYTKTGGSVDATLFAEILAAKTAGTLHAEIPSEWLAMRGQEKTLDVGIFDAPPNSSFLQTLNSKLQQMIVAIKALPNAPGATLPAQMSATFNKMVTDVNTQMANVNNSLGLLSQYGVGGNLIRNVVTTPTLTITAADIGYTFVIMDLVTTSIVVDTGLPEGMFFRVIRRGNGPAINISGTAAKYSINGTTKLQFAGEVCDFLKTRHVNPGDPVVDEYFIDNNQTDKQSISNVKVIVASTYTVTDADKNSILYFPTSSNKTLILNSDLLDGMKFKVIKGGAGEIVFTGTANRYGSDAVKMTVINESANFYLSFKGNGLTGSPSQYDNYLVETIKPITDYVTPDTLTTTINNVVSDLSRFSRVRQTVLGGPVDSNGSALFLQNDSGTIKLLGSILTNPLILSFGDGVDSKGERNIIVMVGGTDGQANTDNNPNDAILSWGSGTVTNSDRFPYIEYNPTTKTLSTGVSTKAPYYTIAKPIDDTTPNIYWYPSDHRQCGEALVSGIWTKVYRIYVGFANTGMDGDPSKQVVSYAYSGMGTVTLDGLVSGINEIPFKTDNWDVEINGFIEMVDGVDGTPATDTGYTSANGFGSKTRISIPTSSYASLIAYTRYMDGSAVKKRYKSLIVIRGDDAITTDYYVPGPTGVSQDIPISPSNGVNLVFNIKRAF